MPQRKQYNIIIIYFFIDVSELQDYTAALILGKMLKRSNSLSLSYVLLR